MKSTHTLILIAASFALTMGAVSPASEHWFSNNKTLILFYDFLGGLFSEEKVVEVVHPGVYLQDASIGEYLLKMSKDCVGLTALRCAQYDIKIAQSSATLCVYLTRHNNQKLYILYQDSDRPQIDDGVLAIYGREAGAAISSFIRLTVEDILRIKNLDNPYTKALDTIEGSRGERCTFMPDAPKGV